MSNDDGSARNEMDSGDGAAHNVGCSASFNGSEEQGTQHWEVEATFDAITYWEQDRMPTPADSMVRNMGWLQVAQAVSI